MGHTFTHHLFHIVFSTKERRPLISLGIEEELFKYICGIANNRDVKILSINGDKEHIHMLALVPPSIMISEFVRAIKANSSKWLSEKFPSLRLFEWQSGYSSFTVSESNADKVIKYIKRQKEHHKNRGFDEELKDFLVKHGIKFDSEHYLD